MQATVDLPEPVLRRLEALAKQEGATSADLIQRLIEAHVERYSPPLPRDFEVDLPLITAVETGPIQPVTGSDVDEILSHDHHTS
jgi:hypothetical protein